MSRGTPFGVAAVTALLLDPLTAFAITGSITVQSSAGVVSAALVAGETPVPTVGGWALAVLALALVSSGLALLHRRRHLLALAVLAAASLIAVALLEGGRAAAQNTLTLSPPSLQFSSPGSQQQLTLFNSGNTPAGSLYIFISGPFSQVNGCGDALAAGTGCRITVTYDLNVCQGCMTGVCIDGVCHPPSCSDGVKNGTESDIDCGGTCGACISGKHCAGGGDCGSGVCTGGICQTASCTDGVKNGGETDIDCGSSCGTCTGGRHCAVAGDCSSGICTAGICQAASCTDGIKNGSETDIDCGGSCGGTCASGKQCAGGGDCSSGVCTSGICQTASCTDAVKNGSETDVDCGGSCGACTSGKQCAAAGDCSSGVCTSGICQTASCTDAVKNGTETDTDCGGPDCATCAIGKSCNANGDCTGGICCGALCAAGPASSCQDAVCGGGVMSYPPKPAGTSCGGGVCDGSGNCVGCNTPADCPGTDTECGTRACTANVCGFSYSPAGLPVSSQIPGDCQKSVCDGSGGITQVADDTDLPADDGNQCTNDACTAGIPSHPFLPNGAACSQNGGSFCDGTGQCVQCNAAADCPGSDTECATRTCNAGVCGVAYSPAGQPVSSQVAGDCRSNVCDGTGGVTSVADATDLPADEGNQCTAEVCIGTTPSHPATTAGTACNQNGGTKCDGSGNCIP